MNKFILSIISILFPFQIFGQMFPSSDHYIFNALVINPAFAGCNEALSATISYRNQWVGFEDAPKSYTLSLHAPFYNDKVGLGLLIEKNSIGIFNETNIVGNYAYRMKLFNGKLALGLGIAATIYNIAWNELDVNDPGDMELMDNPESAVLPNFSMGAFYFTQKYFIGLSLPLFLSHELDQSIGEYRIENNFSKYTYFFTGGYKFKLGSNNKLVPSFLIKYQPYHAIQIDYNAQVNLKDRFWLGIGYRSKNILVGMLQCKLNYQLKVVYSYDYDIGRHGKYTNSSHEIVLNYVFKYSRKVMGPNQF